MRPPGDPIQEGSFLGEDLEICGVSLEIGRKTGRYTADRRGFDREDRARADKEEFILVRDDDGKIRSTLDLKDGDRISILVFQHDRDEHGELNSCFFLTYNHRNHAHYYTVDTVNEIVNGFVPRLVGKFKILTGLPRTLRTIREFQSSDTFGRLLAKLQAL